MKSVSLTIMSLYISNPGTTPKITISERESNCAPISDVALSNLATNPSKKSITAAMNIKTEAKKKLSLKMLAIAKQAKKTFVKVSVLGINLNNASYICFDT